MAFNETQKMQEKCEKCEKTEEDLINEGMMFESGCLSIYAVNNKLLCPKIYFVLLYLLNILALSGCSDFLSNNFQLIRSWQNKQNK